jgi:hypothetical protein
LSWNCNWKRFGIVIALHLVVILLAVWGGYVHFSSLYQEKLNEVIEALIAEPEAKPDVNATTEPPPDVMADAAGWDLPQGAKAAEPAAESATRPPQVGYTPMPETPPAGKQTAPLALSDALIEPAAVAAAAGLSLSASEQSELTSIIGFISQMTLEEKLFCLRAASRFTPAELLSLYRLARRGDGPSIEQLIEKLEAKFNVDEIARIRNLALRYR